MGTFRGGLLLISVLPGLSTSPSRTGVKPSWLRYGHGPEVVLSLCKGATLSPVQSWLDLPVGLLRHFPMRRWWGRRRGRNREGGGGGAGADGGSAGGLALTEAVAAVSRSLPLGEYADHLLQRSQACCPQDSLWTQVRSSLALVPLCPHSAPAIHCWSTV